MNSVADFKVIYYASNSCLTLVFVHSPVLLQVVVAGEGAVLAPGAAESGGGLSLALGTTLRTWVGTTVGTTVGTKDGTIVGSDVGFEDGAARKGVDTAYSDESWQWQLPPRTQIILPQELRNTCGLRGTFGRAFGSANYGSFGSANYGYIKFHRRNGERKNEQNAHVGNW